MKTADIIIGAWSNLKNTQRAIPLSRGVRYIAKKILRKHSLASKESPFCGKINWTVSKSRQAWTSIHISWDYPARRSNIRCGPTLGIEQSLLVHCRIAGLRKIIFIFGQRSVTTRLYLLIFTFKGHVEVKSKFVRVIPPESTYHTCMLFKEGPFSKLFTKIQFLEVWQPFCIFYDVQCTNVQFPRVTPPFFLKAKTYTIRKSKVILWLKNAHRNVTGSQIVSSP